MIELMEKTILTAMGLISISQKKAEELAEEMKQRLNIPEEQGRAFLTKLQDAAKENQKKLEEIAQEEVQKACQRLGVVTHDEYDKLRRKVTQLEKRLKDLG